MEKKKIDINKDIRKKMIWAIIISCMFVVGIPLIIVGAIHNMAVMGIGIAMTVIGFYGTPLIWISYGNMRTLKHVVDAVMDDHLTSMSEIASQLQIRERQARDYVATGIKKKYITGYIFDGANLKSNQKEEPKKKIVKNICPNCGAILEVKENGGYHCPYCNSTFEKE